MQPRAAMLVANGRRIRCVVQYYIRQHERIVSGPHESENIRQWIAEGKVRSEMEFSEDGKRWQPGSAMPELFPPDIKRRRRRRRWRR